MSLESPGKPINAHTQTRHNFIHSSVCGHLHYFHILAKVNSTGMNTGCKYLFELCFSPDICPAVGLQDHMVALLLVFKGNSILFSTDEEVKVTQSCLTLFNPVDCTIHGILQAKILEWVAFPFSRGSSQPRNRTQVSRIAGRFFTS